MTTTNRASQNSRLYYGWVIVIVVALAGFTTSAETLPVLSVFLKPMTEEFEWSRSVFTGAMTIGTVLGGVLAIGIGPLIDRFGGRWILIIGFAIVGGTLVLMAGISELWQFYVLQILARIMTTGVLGLAPRVIVPKWFVSKRGRAIAVEQLAGRMGHAVTPLYLQLLVSLRSWRVASVAAGVVMWTVSLLPVAIFLRRRPEDMGLLPDGGRLTAEGVGSSTPLQPGANISSADPSQEVSLSLRQVLRLTSFYLLLIALTILWFVTSGIYLHLIPYFTDQGLGTGTAVVAVSFLAASAGLGSLVFGLIAERYSTRLVLSVDILLLAAGFIFLLAARSPTAALLWGFYFGIMAGGMQTLEHIVFADYYGRESLGAVRGIVWPAQMGGNSVGPLVAAAAFDITGDYLFIFGFFGFLTLFAGLSVFLARPPVHVTYRCHLSLV